MYVHKFLHIGGTEYNFHLADRDVLPTAYAPATLTRSRSTGIDHADPARFTVTVTIPVDMPGNPVVNPSFENGTTGWSAFGGTFTATATPTNPTGPMAGRVGRSVGQLLTDGVESTVPVYQEGIPVPAAQWAAFRVWAAFQPSELMSLQLRQEVWFYDDIGDLITQARDAWTPGTSYQPGTHLTMTAQVPPEAATCDVQLSMRGLRAGQESEIYEASRLWLDDVRLGFGPTVDLALSALAYNGPPQLGAAVQASVVGREQDDNLSFVGQVESLSRRRRTLRQPDGSTFDVDSFDVAATDLFGVLARRTVGDVPWPREQVPDRWNRIRALVPDIPMVKRDDYSGFDFVAPRDVDNTSALSLLRDTVAMLDNELLIDDAGMVNYRQRNQTITAPDTWDPDEPEPYIRGGAFSTIHLPARAFADPGDVQDYDLVVNVARVTGKRYDAGEDDYPDRIVTFTNADSRTRHGESTWSVSGDGLADGGNVPDVTAMPAARRARRLVDTAGDPLWRLAGEITAVPHLVTDDTPTSWVTDLMSTDQVTPIVMLDGAPEGRDIWRVIGLSATWGSDAVEALSLTVEPYEMAGPLGLTFVATFTSGDPFTFALSAPMTFRQARTVDDIGFFE